MFALKDQRGTCKKNKCGSSLQLRVNGFPSIFLARKITNPLNNNRILHSTAHHRRAADGLKRRQSGRMDDR